MTQETETKAVEYRDIPNWPHYRAGSDGTIWSRKRKGGNDRVAGKLSVIWKELSQSPNSSGYSCVNLFKNGINHVVPVCYLVLEAFVGPRPPRMEVRHFPDADRRNSRLENLRWDTPSANQQDRKVHGTVTRLAGETNPSAKLTDQNVLEVVRRRNAGESYKKIAAAFGTTKANICRICTGKSWRHVTGGPLEKRYARRNS